MLIELKKDSPIYERFNYPGGEMQVRIRPGSLALVEAARQVTILARITKHEDIIELAMLRNTIDARTDCALVLPYLPYSRADRKFVDGDCFGLLSFGKFLFPMGWNRVITLDAHNEKAALSCCDARSASPQRYIEDSIVNFARQCVSETVTVLLPDDGAAKRYRVPVDVMGIKVKTLHCEKERDAATGKLTGFTVPELPPGPVLIVDDICDGGGTFLGIAEKIDAYRPLGLYTTHGIYSKGTHILSRFALYTTNSFQETYPGVVKVFDCIPSLLAS